MDPSTFETFISSVIRDYTHTAMRLTYSQPDFEQKFDAITSQCTSKIVKFCENEMKVLRDQTRENPPLKRKKVENPEKMDLVTPEPQKTELKPEVVVTKITPPKEVIVIHERAPTQPQPEIKPKTPTDKIKIPHVPQPIPGKIVEKIEPSKSTDTTTTPQQRIPWKVEEIQLMIDGRNNNKSWKEICALIPHRTMSSLKSYWFASIADKRILFVDGKYVFPSQEGSLVSKPSNTLDNEVYDHWTEREIMIFRDLKKEHQKSDVTIWKKAFPHRTLTDCWKLYDLLE